ncbi:ABC transporter substrate-binding protein [Paenibacillus sp. N3.4]|uniref:ABC transporter substrate-binding protein n=1 Tax=Paenibacillus sp. N3.4 TaxID=2603222 RepID=UPI0011C97F30|nr:ABC transporter substrate-binding protein [Paenibacillus sp. N3.4]TXK84656.1 carbohydrate ABC transporter substrate-binding protein [Paenibacillus sp. N3.4]
MKKFMSMITVIGLAGGLLAGCGTKADDKAVASPKQSAPVKKVTLNLLQSKVEISDQVKQMAADYSNENPNVTIETQLSADLDTLLKTRFASGEEPDIFFAKSYSGVKDWKERLLDLSNEPWMSQVQPFAEPGMTVDGKKYGFPSAIEGYGFVYNKELFAKAGIEKVPVTLTELKQVNEKLKAAGIASFSEGYKETWVLGRHLFNLPFAYMTDPQGNVDKINAGTMKIKDMPTLDSFFEILDMTIKYGKGAESVGISYDNQVANFASGKSAMMQQGVWAIDPILKINPNIKMGMFAVPFTDNEKETKLPVGVPAYYVINKNSKNVEEAKKFLIWLHKNGQKYLVDSMRMIPAFKDMKATDELGPLAKDMTAYVDKNQTIPFAHLLWPSGMDKQFARPLQAYVGGQFPRDQVLAEVQKMWDSTIKK